MKKIKVAIIGVGNCASSLVQGVEYYKDADPSGTVPGLMHVQFGDYHVRDIEFVAAYDVDAKKVGQDLALARDQQTVVDGHGGDLAGPFQGDGHEPAAGGAGGGGFSHFRLGILQLLLHRLGLLHEGVEIHGTRLGAGSRLGQT